MAGAAYKKMRIEDRGPFGRVHRRTAAAQGCAYESGTRRRASL